MNTVRICDTHGRNISIECYREKVEGWLAEDEILGPLRLWPWYGRYSYLRLWTCAF